MSLVATGLVALRPPGEGYAKEAALRRPGAIVAKQGQGAQPHLDWPYGLSLALCAAPDVAISPAPLHCLIPATVAALDRMGPAPQAGAGPLRQGNGGLPPPRCQPPCCPEEWVRRLPAALDSDCTVSPAPGPWPILAPSLASGPQASP